MAKFHINPETGNVGECKAEVQCRFGGDSAHYSTADEARFAYETTQEALAEMQLETPVEIKAYSLTKRALENAQNRSAYTEEQIADCLARIETYGVRDRDFASWISDLSGDTLDELDAKDKLNVKYFAMKPIPWASDKLQHSKQVAHRVGPYEVSTRPVNSLGSGSTRRVLVETLVWDSRDEYGTPVFEEGTWHEADNLRQHELGILAAQSKVLGIEA